MADNLLVTTDWLGEHLHDHNLRIIDIRGHVIPPNNPLPHYFNHHADYLKSHLPGAVFLDWVLEITDPDDPVHGKIAKPERFAAAMSRCGIGPETFVVAYDDANGMFAARLWWALNYYGHEQVAVLDGGWQKWITEGRHVTVQEPIVKPRMFSPHPNPALVRTGDQVEAALHSETRLVDVRSPEEFVGKWSRAKRKGHIPSAINRPRTDLITSSGTMLPPEQLREKFRESGIDESAPEVITYCNAGVSASYGYLALCVAGFTNAAVYDGSWKDWANNDARPIE